MATVVNGKSRFRAFCHHKLLPHFLSHAAFLTTKYLYLLWLLLGGLFFPMQSIVLQPSWFLQRCCGKLRWCWKSNHFIIVTVSVATERTGSKVRETFRGQKSKLHLSGKHMFLSDTGLLDWRLSLLGDQIWLDWGFF